MLDTKALADATALIVKAHVNAIVTPLLARIDAMEKHIASMPVPKDGANGVDGKDGEPGRDGVDGIPGENGKDAEVTHEMLVEAVKANVDAINEAVAGYIAANPPADGKDADPDEIRAMVTEAVAGLPDPVPGKDGESIDPADVQKMVDAAVAALPPAEPGKNADPEQVAALIKETAEAILSTWDRPEDGKSVTVDDVQPMVAELVDKAVAAIPVPKDGKDGADVKELLIDRDGCLVATLSDGRMKTLGTVVGKDGEPGRDGEKGADGRDGLDGIGFDDMTFETREDGCYLVWEKGDVVKEARLPIPMDRGVYKEGGAYHGGDGVTWGGNYYIATENTSAKPDTSKDGKPWRLAVRRGRDGKDFTPKPKDKA